MVGIRGTGTSAFVLFLALAAGSAIAAPIRIAQTSAAEIEFWRSVESMKDPAELRAYLQSYPNGQFAPLAKLRLEKLQWPAQQQAIPTAPEAAPRTIAPDVPPLPLLPRRGWIGISIQNVDEARVRESGEIARGGALIVALVSFGPGLASGLRPGDIVLAIGGETLTGGMQHLIRLAGALAPGTSTDVSALRSGQRHTFKLTAGNFFEDHWNAAHRGNIDAMISLGSTYAGGTLIAQDQRLANEWFRKAADAGSPAAMNTLGDRYRFGQGFERDDREAIRWYRKAAAGGSGPSMFSLGLSYYRGQGVERDYAQAVNWYRLAIAQNHPGAMQNFGLALQDGIGVEKNEILAIDYFRRASKLGQPEAFASLALAYYDGRGITKDDREAARLFREAANRNVGVGFSGLAKMYERGEGGFTRNHAEAIKHYRKAAEAGDTNAIGRLKEIGTSVYDPMEIQQLLSDLGFDPGPVDGQPGRKTDQAIREFRKSRGLPTNAEPSLALVGQLRDALKQKTAASAKAPAPNVGAASDLGKLQHLEKLD